MNTPPRPWQRHVPHSNDPACSIIVSKTDSRPVASPSDPTSTLRITSHLHTTYVMYPACAGGHGDITSNERQPGSHRAEKQRIPTLAPEMLHVSTRTRTTANSYYRTATLSSQRVDSKQCHCTMVLPYQPQVSVKNTSFCVPQGNTRHRRGSTQSTDATRCKAPQHTVRCGVWQGDARDTRQTSFARLNCCDKPGQETGERTDGRTGERERQRRRKRQERQGEHEHTHTKQNKTKKKYTPLSLAANSHRAR